ncbi:hypothetical protein GCM10020221_09690 [Streptomyces thioluteus]|uniref:Uncharacterized protein n=1 Tax=Streptomyces thioluteus TaxID=66431 RepID=A0ABN3WIZ3_STRTU
MKSKKQLLSLKSERTAGRPRPPLDAADRNSYRLWQRKLGFTGSDADGLPGRTSWDALKVPRS